MNPTELLRGVFCFVLLALATTGCRSPDEPRINDRFPIKEGRELSPPMVYKPIHECAQVVHVYSFVPHAMVTVYANMIEQIGQTTPYFAFADIPLTRPLKLGEKVTATQTVLGQSSGHSIQAVMVSAYPTGAGGFNKPAVGKDLYECGVIVPVDNLVPSVTVKAFKTGRRPVLRPPPIRGFRCGRSRCTLPGR